MGLRSLRRLVFALNVLAIYHATVHGCSEPRYWRSKGVAMRAVRADMVIVGKVVRSPYPSRQPNTANAPQFGPYDARFQLICVLKGKVRPKNVVVSGFGYIPGHCASSRALRNETYIAFLRRRHGHYFVSEINSQVGTALFKTSILRKVARRLRRNDKLNKSRRGCAALLRTLRQSSKKIAYKSKVKIHGDSAFARGSDSIATTSQDRRIASTISGNRGVALKSSWVSVIMFLVYYVGYPLT